MLIVSTGGKITLDRLIKADEKVRDFDAKQKYKVARDYVKSVESFKKKDGKPKSYEDLTREELKKVIKNVEQGMALRYFSTYSEKTASEFSEAIKSGDDVQIERIRGWYIRDANIKNEDMQNIAKQGASISSFLELSEKAGKGIIQTENALYKNLIDYDDTKKIIQGVSEGYKKRNIGIHYKAEEFKEDIEQGNLERLMSIIEQYKQDKYASKMREALGGKKPKK
ncbi:MAG: hypothetical protein KKA61_04195 [Nanoarchaeota archaeon]|nr:hypothetical protein [Nanoarchaeota archaeon]